MKLLLTGAFKYKKEQLDLLKSIGYELTFIQDERIPLEFDVSDIEVVICNSLFEYNDIKKFKNLKFIQLTSAGLDRVPLNYINEKGIKLCDAKGIYNIPMAEWVVLKILEIAKKSKNFYELQKNHKWEKQRDLFELTNKTVAIIGFGGVGEEVAKRLSGFGLKIIGVGRRVKQSNFVDQYYLIDQIEEVLKKSDIVILTLPFNKETNHLIDDKKISIMKENSILINVSRGGIIDEMALINALRNNKFSGVALDVFEKEPLLKESPLWDFQNIIISPHNSFVSDKIELRLFNLIKESLIKFKQIR